MHSDAKQMKSVKNMYFQLAPKPLVTIFHECVDMRDESTEFVRF